MFAHRSKLWRLIPGLLAVVLLLAACTTDRVFWLTEDRYPALPPNSEVRLFSAELNRPHVRIALVQSFADPRRSQEVRRRQIDDLRRRARSVGADAVMEIRLLRNRVRGPVTDEAVPFPAVRQGRYETFFLRGVAIRFTDPPTTGTLGAPPPDGPDAAPPVQTEADIPESEARDPEDPLTEPPPPPPIGFTP